MVNYKENLEKVFTLFPRMAERQKQERGTLSGGEQHILANGRALINNPKLLRLDYPSLGLAPVIVEEVYQVVTEIRKNGTPILLVEKNAFQALNVADRGYIVETVNIVSFDASDKLLEDDKVKQAYLGE
jgi:branched-chain amino acid transport system ATP-binding protein